MIYASEDHDPTADAGLAVDSPTHSEVCTVKTLKMGRVDVCRYV